MLVCIFGFWAQNDEGQCYISPSLNNIRTSNQDCVFATCKVPKGHKLRFKKKLIAPFHTHFVSFWLQIHVWWKAPNFTPTQSTQFVNFRPPFHSEICSSMRLHFSLEPPPPRAEHPNFAELSKNPGDQKLSPAARSSWLRMPPDVKGCDYLEERTIHVELPTVSIWTCICLPGTVYQHKSTLCSKGLWITDTGGASMLGRFHYELKLRTLLTFCLIILLISHLSKICMYFFPLIHYIRSFYSFTPKL